jgi:hypothetical protein
MACRGTALLFFYFAFYHFESIVFFCARPVIRAHFNKFVFEHILWLFIISDIVQDNEN